MTDTTNVKVRNWVCYDADCPLCLRWVRRFRGALENHGFTLLPLQSPAVRSTLNLPETDLLIEMRVVTGTGQILGGADALLYLAGVIWKPLGVVTRVPGVKPLLRLVYRFIASRRTCGAGACAAKPLRVGNPADWLPLLLFPPAAAAIGKMLPPWIYMWVLAFALFLGAKWLSLRTAITSGTKIGFKRALAFLFGWIGMDAANFSATAEKCSPSKTIEWTFAAAKTLFGGILVWFVARLALNINPLLAGWTGMIGLMFVLHFGFFHLLALAWRANGLPVEPLMRAPLLSRSLGEFWGVRWNTAFHRLAARFVFRPARRAAGLPAATLLVFLVSGLVHDLVISVPARDGYGLPTLYFLLQGAGVLFERTGFARRCGIGRGVRGWLFTFFITAGPAFWLFHPPFIRQVILPMLHAIGAT